MENSSVPPDFEAFRESAASEGKLRKRSEYASPLSATIDCGRRRATFILKSKIPWNQKVAIVLRVSFSGAKRCARICMKRPRQKYIFRSVSKTNRGHVSMPVLLRISEMCERICRLAGEVGCGGVPTSKWRDSKHVILTNNTAPGPFRSAHCPE